MKNVNWKKYFVIKGTLLRCVKNSAVWHCLKHERNVDDCDVHLEILTLFSLCRLENTPSKTFLCTFVHKQCLSAWHRKSSVLQQHV